MKFYLLNMSLCGIKNISNEIKLEFYKKVVNKKFDPEKYRVKAIYGENGSGKTAIVTAVSIIRDLFIKPMYLNQKDTQIFLDEIINKETRELSCGFEFLVYSESDYRIYDYKIEIAKDNNNQYSIKHEHLRTKNANTHTNPYVEVFETKDGLLTFLDLEEEAREKTDRKVMNLISQNTFVWEFISNQNIEFNEKTIKTFMYIVSTFVFFSSLSIYLDQEDTHESYLFRQQMDDLNIKDEKTLANVLELRERQDAYFRTKNCDLVRKDLYDQYLKKVEQLEKFLKLFKPNLKKIDIDRRDDGEEYRCELLLNYGTYSVNSEFESTGIKKLIRIFDCLNVASNGSIVFIDEMDSNINDVYLCKMIEYFMYFGKGQLCFTSHNLSPMAVLKENKNSIDFLSDDNHVVSWSTKGNAAPDNYYRNGMIQYSPFNIDPVDFIGIFGGDN